LRPWPLQLRLALRRRVHARSHLHACLSTRRKRWRGFRVPSCVLRMKQLKPHAVARYRPRRSVTRPCLTRQSRHPDRDKRTGNRSLASNSESRLAVSVELEEQPQRFADAPLKRQRAVYRLLWTSKLLELMRKLSRRIAALHLPDRRRLPSPRLVE
jgi:hypothetical protein